MLIILKKVSNILMKKGGITSLKVVASTKPLARPDEKETEDSCLYHCVCPPNTKRKSLIVEIFLVLLVLFLQ